MNTEFCSSHTEVKMTVRYPGGDIKKESRNMSQRVVRKEIRTWQMVFLVNQPDEIIKK